MCARNLNGAHISQCSATLLDYETWKWLCSLNELALAHMKRSLGKEDDIFLFYDHWLLGIEGNLTAQLSDTLIPAHMRQWKVSN